MQFNQQHIRSLLLLLLGLDQQTLSTPENELVENLLKQPRVFNAFFDLVERIYDANSELFTEQLDLSQAPLFQILQQQRIATFKPVTKSIIEPQNELQGVLESESRKTSKQSPPDKFQNSSKNLPQPLLEQSLKKISKSSLSTLAVKQLYELGQQLEGLSEPTINPSSNDLTEQLLDAYSERFNRLYNLPSRVSERVSDHVSEDGSGSALSNTSTSTFDDGLSTNTSPINKTVNTPNPPDKTDSDKSTVTAPASHSPSGTAKKVTKMPYFQMPNARVGQSYQAQIKMQSNQQSSQQQALQLKPDSVVLPAELGIEYDSEHNCFCGTPLKAGEFKVSFEYQHNDKWLAGDCAFIITADPRSLWQVREPSDDLAYAKPHGDQQIITQNVKGQSSDLLQKDKQQTIKLIAASRRGRSHEHAGTFRDDDFFIQTIGDNGWSVLVVTDGAGSAEFSREGARIAAQTVGQRLCDEIQQHGETFDAQLNDWQTDVDVQPSKEISQQLFNHFYEAYHQAAVAAISQIEQTAAHHSTTAKAFATTLLVAVVRQQGDKTFVCTCWVGDGAIAVYSPDNMRLMGKPDSGEFAGQTRFLDKSITAQFDKRVNLGFFKDVQAVILMTDGVSDPKFETDSGLANQQRWNDFWQDIAPCLNEPEPQCALLEWLHFFNPGHHDDRTLALLLPSYC